MERCKKCNVPLSGILSTIPKKLLGVESSLRFPDLCNKCEPKEGTYSCQICGRDIDESAAMMHVKTEEYLLELIRRDHPQWKEKQGTCHTCLDYYRKLVKDAEI